MAFIQVARVGGIFAGLLLMAALVFGGTLSLAQAAELPFDYPASGSEILCHMNGLTEVDGVPVVRPTIPTFDVGTCAEAPSPLPACSNSSDDDDDGFTDTNDPNCHTDGDPSNSASYDPDKDDESGDLPACWNKEDDDDDGKKDFPNDPGCSSPTDSDESDGGGGGPPPAPQCSNGSDDDGDGLTDSADPGCSDPSDNDESNSTGGGSPSTGSGSSSGGGGGGGGGKSKTSTSTGLVLGFSTTTESCDRYLTEFIREGNDNDTDQVKRLQRFLRDFEGAQVQETGIYDKVTLAAVHTFQTKYAADILAPWGIEESTGYVYLTTRKKVNEIFCRFTKTFFLTTDELKKIETVRAAALGIPLSPVAPKPASPTPTPSVPTAAAGTASSGASGDGPLKSVFDFLQGVWEQYR